MYEFHGWATIHESIEETDTGKLDCIVENIQNYISDLKWSNGILLLYPVNGMYHLTVGGFLNRKTSEVKDIINLYQFIADQAPGSYGVLYTKDDEDLEGYHNEFKVIVLVRGKLQEKEDLFLSPFIPVVEDSD